MPNTDQVLAELAQKLGVSAQYLWLTLLSQQRLEGCIYCVIVIAFAVLYYFVPKIIGRTFESDVEEQARFTTECYLLGLILFVPLEIGIGYWAITDLVRPAYGALYEIMQKIK